MKKFLLIIVILGAGYFIFNSFYNYNPIKIKGNIIVNQTSNWDINSASVKNTGEKALANILIIYTVGYDSLSAFTNFLDAGNSTLLKQITAV